MTGGSAAAPGDPPDPGRHPSRPLRRCDRGQDGQQGGLARPVGAEHASDSRRELEIDLVKRGCTPVATASPLIAPYRPSTSCPDGRSGQYHRDTFPPEFEDSRRSARTATRRRRPATPGAVARTRRRGARRQTESSDDGQPSRPDADRRRQRPGQGGEHQREHAQRQAGATISSGSQARSGSASAASTTGTSDVAITATERMKNSHTPETGAAVVMAADGSKPNRTRPRPRPAAAAARGRTAAGGLPGVHRQIRGGDRRRQYQTHPCQPRPAERRHREQPPHVRWHPHRPAGRATAPPAPRA